MDVLTAHPELASGMFKVISDALTDAQKTVQDLQRTLDEQVRTGAPQAEPVIEFFSARRRLRPRMELQLRILH
jgi:hypothetical protein